MNEIKVSVIIPIYNVESYIKKSLDSVINQTLKDIEIICVDDGSSDTSVSIVEKYCEIDSRIKLIKHEKNRGQGAARNTGIGHSVGEYITFLDSDDWIDPYCYEKAYKKSKQLNLDYLLFKISTFDDVTGEINDNDPYLTMKVLDDIDKSIFNHNDTKDVTCNICVHVGSKFYKREFLINNDLMFPEGFIFEDEPFFYNVYLNARRVSILDENLYYYRVSRENSTIASKGKSFVDVVKAFKFVRQAFISSYNYDKEYRGLLFNKFFYSIFTRLEQTSEEFKQEFFLEIKKDFKSFLTSQNDINLLYPSYQKKALNVLFSEDYSQFKQYEEGIIKNNATINDIDIYYKISIIIPTFNVEKYISRALNSIINQTIGFSNLEIIVIDDLSTDNTRDIIQQYANKYSNIKPIFLNSNSGFAGKPRNIGVGYASANYLMFLDPDDYYVDNACEILYEKIKNENNDIVSGNFVDVKFNNNNKYDWADKFNVVGNDIQINSIEENTNLFNIYPSVWAKIFRRDFILENNIYFPIGVPGQDLFFVYLALLKAKGIGFIDKEVVIYEAREGDDSSVTCINDKNVINGLIKVYEELYAIMNNYLPKISHIVLRQLYFLIDKFIKSDTDIPEIYEIVSNASYLFTEFLNRGLVPHEDKRDLFENISKNNPEFVVMELDKIKWNNPKKRLNEIIRKKDVLLLCYNIDYQMTGLTRAVLNRSKSLAADGFNVTILTVDFGTNYHFIQEKMQNLGHLHESIKIVNLFDYFRVKNTELSINNNILHKEEYDDLEIINNGDQSKDINYFKNGIKFKTERYFNEFLAYEWIYENDECIEEKAFTEDGFCFFVKSLIHGRNFYNLINRNGVNVHIGGAHEYNQALKLQDYFVQQFCKSCSEKPFLILECVGHIPSLGNIDSNIAYLVGQLHSNVYKEPYSKGSELKSFSAVNFRENLDFLITLTDKQKEDLVEDLKFERIRTIPNIVDEIPILGVEKNPNKVSFCSRISPEKNIFDIVKAFKIVVNEIPTARLDIFGRATLPHEVDVFNELKSFVKTNNLEDNIHFRGHIDNLQEEIEESMVTVLASDFEGYPLSMVESMIGATPVICYNFNYGPQDVIINGENGTVVDKGDVTQLANAIIEALRNSENTIEMGINARNHLLNNFSEKIIVSKWENLLKDILLNYSSRDNKIKVSVIIPCFNVEKYIGKCLDSIVNQSLKEIEIICVDDGSTDNTLDILLKYAASDDRIIVISKQNEGQGPSRNLGLDFVNGEYFAFVDSDDWLDFETYEEIYNFSKSNDLDMCMFKLINYNDETSEIYESGYYNIGCLRDFEKVVFNHFDILNIFSIPVSPCNKLYKTYMFKKFNIKFPSGYSMFEDNPFFFNAFLSSNKVSFIPKHFYYRRVRADSTMTSKSNLADIIGISNEIINVFFEKNLFQYYKSQLFDLKISTIKMWFDRSDYDYKPYFYDRINEEFNQMSSSDSFNSIKGNLEYPNRIFYENILLNNTFKEYDLYNRLFDLTNKYELLISENQELRHDYDTLVEFNNDLSKKYGDLINFNNLNDNEVNSDEINEKLLKKYNDLKLAFANLNMEYNKVLEKEIYLTKCIKYNQINHDKNKFKKLFSKYF